MTGHGLYSTAWWVSMADFLILIGLQLVMNWPVGVRMFALSW